MPPFALRTSRSPRTRSRSLTQTALTLLCVALLSGCSWIEGILPRVYRPDIQQGVVVTQEMAAQLRPGLSRDQVRFVMGTPPIEDPFHKSRWDYPYRFQSGRGDVELRHYTVYFEDDKMVRAEGDPLPTESEFVDRRIKLNIEASKRGGADQGPNWWVRLLSWLGLGDDPNRAPLPPAPSAPPTSPPPPTDAGTRPST